MQMKFVHGFNHPYKWWKWWSKRSPFSMGHYDPEEALELILDRINSMTYDSSKVNDVNL